MCPAAGQSGRTTNQDRASWLTAEGGKPVTFHAQDDERVAVGSTSGAKPASPLDEADSEPGNDPRAVAGQHCLDERLEAEPQDDQLLRSAGNPQAGLRLERAHKSQGRALVGTHVLTSSACRRTGEHAEPHAPGIVLGARSPKRNATNPANRGKSRYTHLACDAQRSLMKGRQPPSRRRCA